MDGTGTGYVPTDEESAALTERIDAALDDISARIAALPMTLDDAWREAEAALPEGWRLASIQGYAASWTACAASPRPEVIGACECCGQDRHAAKQEFLFGRSPTPAAALQALAARLRESR